MKRETYWKKRNEEMNKKKDRFRNKIFRRFGFVPADDFLTYVNDVHKVLTAFEAFTSSTNDFCAEISKYLGIKFNAGTITSDGGKSSEDVEREYREKGMI